jgi:hypothetical protein
MIDRPAGQYNADCGGKSKTGVQGPFAALFLLG